ncbi:hypothetical protein [Marinitenerispora sediminis]|uniref:Uncharacterized protein n=1 Tax=Marinitenerispora sediminis TaxID=1931232 RepID=A0A368T504_9ACTN|nr:hypothetical protein [Marinitenerispora sediminis]RCV48773.1 hypothetical protein DEF28_22680 [Marinitenerispora sediminis]RCV50901.1 hypothetical protein DEF23_21385 [Marinitenerispora sediminis]RCV58679.1 hypothetical protein DEF24_12635 [Marinitenerispora sediminis]
MGTSLYSTATRARALTPEERERVGALVERYRDGLVDRIEDAFPGRGRELVREYCEPFGWYSDDALAPGEILDGAVKISHTQAPWEVMAAQVEHWLALLGEVRAAVPGAEWQVHLDGVHAGWDPEAGCFSLP